MPLEWYFRVFMWMWKSISALRSRSISSRCQKDHARLYNSSNQHIYSSCLCDSEHARNRDVDSAVLIDFAGELLAAGRRQLIEAGAAIIVGRAPLGDHPAFQQHTLQGGVQRPFLHLQNVAGGLLDVLGDSIA